MSRAQEILKQYWGYDAFRPMQEDIIDSIASGKDTLAILPTGGGKSICFQLPALMKEGICIVVSPLIALMKDQVENLKKRNIPALLIHSGMKKADVIQTLKNATHDYFKFLYVSPERLETSLFREYLPGLNVNLIAIDEAHCISQWGYDFRPSYLRIANLREELPDVPVLALTASATKEVQQDICTQLKFGKSNIFGQTFERPNLSYSVFRAEAKSARLVEIIQNVPGTAIVYGKSRRRTVEIAQLLQAHGISASYYHAGLSTEERNQRQKDWIENRVRVMACTNAFGMGIDKPDVRLVVHMDAPDCLENYYQEAGRAGRDGKKAYAVLLYTEPDIGELKEQVPLRFPEIDEIRALYRAIVNYLQIPTYNGEYRSYLFRFDEFISKYKLDAHRALYALKALESDGWVQYNEKNFAPSTLVFTTSKRNLEEFYKAHHVHELLLTTLLRTYGGILDYPAFIQERTIAKALRKDETEIKAQLQQIASFGVVSYSPQNEDPQLIFLRQRVSEAEWTFRKEPYFKRRDRYVLRLNRLIDYVRTEQCRSAFISRYFGDEGAKDCGSCDNCLRRKNGELTNEEFDNLSIYIRQRLSAQPLAGRQLLEGMPLLKKEKAWKVIEFLQKENELTVDDLGRLKLNR